MIGRFKLCNVKLLVYLERLLCIPVLLGPSLRHIRAFAAAFSETASVAFAEVAQSVNLDRSFRVQKSLMTTFSEIFLNEKSESRKNCFLVFN